MKTTSLPIAKITRQVPLAIFSAAMLMLFAAAADSAYAQEGSSASLILVPTQERIPQADWRINPEYIIPPIGSPPSSPSPAATAAPVIRNPSPFKVPLIMELERGKWYVQIGAYARAAHVEDAINRVGTASPVVVQNAGTDINPMFKVLLGPFTQSESKTMLKRFRDKGYDAFLRSGD